MITGDSTEYEQGVLEMCESDFASNNAFLTQYQSLMTLPPFWRGEWESARDQVRQVENRLEGNPENGLRPGLELLYACYLGDEEAARAVLAKNQGRMPATTERPVELGQWIFLAYVVEGLFVLHSREKTAALYPFAEGALRTGTKVVQFGERLFETVAGIAAGAGRQWDVAERHFEQALRQAAELPFQSEQADARRFYSSVLIERDGPGDRDKAKRLLEEAIEGYRAISMPRHLQLVETELERLSG